MCVCASHNDKVIGSAYSVGLGKVGPEWTFMTAALNDRSRPKSGP